MKRSAFLLFSILLIVPLWTSNIYAQSIPINVGNKIIINVVIDIGPQGVSAHTLNVTNFPNHLTTNNPIPLEVHYQNNTLIDYYIHVDHLGFIVESNSQNSGGVQPVRVPPNDPGNSAFQVVQDQLPQAAARYLFGLGDHKLTFRLLNTEEDTLNNIVQDQISFTIHPTINSSDIINNTLAYPNPFTDQITFDLSEKMSLSENVTLTLYDQNGRIKDQIKDYSLNNFKVTYYSNTLPKGRYYYMITSLKGQKISSGIILKQ